MGRRTTNTFATIKDTSSRAANHAGGKIIYSTNTSPTKHQKAEKPMINQNIFERVSKVTVFELPLGMSTTSIQQTFVP